MRKPAWWTAPTTRWRRRFAPSGHGDGRLVRVATCFRQARWPAPARLPARRPGDDDSSGIILEAQCKRAARRRAVGARRGSLPHCRRPMWTRGDQVPVVTIPTESTPNATHQDRARSGAITRSRRPGPIPDRLLVTHVRRLESPGLIPMESLTGKFAMAGEQCLPALETDRRPRAPLVARWSSRIGGGGEGSGVSP
jgi:hypothetical protein